MNEEVQKLIQTVMNNEASMLALNESSLKLSAAVELAEVFYKVGRLHGMKDLETLLKSVSQKPQPEVKPDDGTSTQV